MVILIRFKIFPIAMQRSYNSRDKFIVPAPYFQEIGVTIESLRDLITAVTFVVILQLLVTYRLLLNKQRPLDVFVISLCKLQTEKDLVFTHVYDNRMDCSIRYGSYI